MMGWVCVCVYLFEHVQVVVTEAHYIRRNVVILVHEQLQHQWDLGLQSLQGFCCHLHVCCFGESGPAEHQSLTHSVYQARELSQEVHVLLLRHTALQFTLHSVTLTTQCETADA